MIGQAIQKGTKAAKNIFTDKKCRLCQTPGRIENIEKIPTPDENSTELEILCYDLTICISCIQKIKRATELAYGLLTNARSKKEQAT